MCKYVVLCEGIFMVVIGGINLVCIVDVVKIGVNSIVVVSVII